MTFKQTVSAAWLLAISTGVCIGFALGNTNPVRKPLAPAPDHAYEKLTLVTDNASAVPEHNRAAPRLSTPTLVHKPTIHCYQRSMQAVPGGVIGPYGNVTVCESL